jgi:ribosome maturation factor RimP
VDIEKKEGAIAPFLLKNMDKETIAALLNKKLEELNLFLVELNISADHVITIYADGMENISVGQCTEIARYLRGELGEAADDFEMTVSSPGLDRPFVLQQQYQKNLGKSIEVLTKEGNKIEGKLNAVNEQEIVVNVFKKRNPKNKALKPEVSNQLITLELKDIKQAKKLIII